MGKSRTASHIICALTTCTLRYVVCLHQEKDKQREKKKLFRYICKISNNCKIKTSSVVF